MIKKSAKHLVRIVWHQLKRKVGFVSRERSFPLVLMIALAITPIISIFFPRFLAFWPLIIGLATSGWLLFFKKELFRVSRLYYICAGAVSLLCLLSTLWSISPMQSAEDAIKVTAILMIGGLFISSFKALEFEDFKPYGWLLPAGLIVATLLCAFDLVNDLAIYGIFHDTNKLDFNTSVMNRGIICCVFAFFIALPFIQSLDWKESHKLILTALAGITTVVMLALSQSQSGQLAFILGLLLFFVFPARHRFSYILLGLALLVSFISTPFITDFLYNYLLPSEDAHMWIREAYIGNRIEIWNFVMVYAMNNPLYGHGIEATNYVSHFGFEPLYNEGDTFLHPHNFVIQIWMEFGLIGIILLSAVLGVFLSLLYRIQNLTARKSLSVLFIIVLFAASVTYGLWQSWWLGELLFLIGMGAFLSNMGASTSRQA